jgi:hypothetical protein
MSPSLPLQSSGILIYRWEMSGSYLGWALIVLTGFTWCSVPPGEYVETGPDWFLTNPFHLIIYKLSNHLWLYLYVLMCC